MRSIIASLSVIAVVGLLAFGASNAFFSDTETSSGNTFVAGAFDLLVNGEDNPDSIVDVPDLKPGDNHIEEKTLFIQNPAYVWLHIKDIVTKQGEQTEPERLWESENDEKKDIENHMLYDLSIKDNPLITLEDKVTLYEAHSCWIPLGEIESNTEITLYQSFHFPEEVENWAQGDKLTFTEEFYAEQVRNNPNPTPPDTKSGRVWDPKQKKCVDDVLWIIGDIEDGQLDNPVDELNWPGAFGSFPTPPAIGDDYTRSITQPVDDTADLEFPWNTNFNSDYARNIDIDFNYTGSSTNVRLTIAWSPGKSALERKEVFYDGGSKGILSHTGVSTAGWWESMPRYEDTIDFLLNPGLHTIRLEHLQGDGTLWDYIKLEKI